MFEKLNKLCLVIGSTRTGSTLIGQILNAHRNVALSNEIAIPERLLYEKMSREVLFNMIIEECISENEKGNIGGGGYSYTIPDQYQGKFEDLEVIGDKTAFFSVLLMHFSSNLVDTIEAVTRLPVYFIHSVRNPFDAVATMIKYTGSTQRNRAGAFFSICEAAYALRERVGSKRFLNVRHENLIKNKIDTISSMCDFLDIPASEDYLNACSLLIRDTAHRSRTLVKWSPEVTGFVMDRIGDYDFLDGYTLDG
jgi:hypothetical protein